MSDTHQRRVVVTGIGLVSGLGIGTEQTWEGLLAGRSGIAPITLFDPKDFACRFAGEVKEFAGLSLSKIGDLGVPLIATDEQKKEEASKS